ncbi:MAG: hypothetical protein AAF636_08445 [Pseudomonadota bacterium]
MTNVTAYLRMKGITEAPGTVVCCTFPASQNRTRSREVGLVVKLILLKKGAIQNGETREHFHKFDAKAALEAI